MIMKMKIEKLFGRFNYDIEFKARGVTIITGPNGYGKSTILKCLEVLSENSHEDPLLYFSKLNFEKIVILLENPNQEISIIKNKNEIIINGIVFPIRIFLQRNAILDQRMGRVNGDKFISRKDKEMYINEQLYFKEAFSNTICVDDDVYLYETDNVKRFSKRNFDTMRQIKKTIAQIRKSIGSIYFIEEQRLIMQKFDNRNRINNVVNVIEELPFKFQNLIRTVSSNYSAIANELDSTYPYRLFNTESGINEEEYKRNMTEMKEKFEKLSKYDISEMQYSYNVLFKTEHAKALKIYFEDFNMKYKEYEDFVKKLDLFTDIVNSRLTFKKIKISRKDGIVIIDENCVDNSLSLNQLSSGEKQEIVLFYDLIFGVSNNVLLLIDEPEISLHIVWQKMFMDDLLKIVEYKGLKVIVATHSPQIINNHWDIQVDLGELYGNELYKN